MVNSLGSNYLFAIKPYVVFHLATNYGKTKRQSLVPIVEVSMSQSNNSNLAVLNITNSVKRSRLFSSWSQLAPSP